MKLLVMKPDELASKWPLDVLDKLNENEALSIEHHVWKSILFPSSGELFYVATHYGKPAAMMSIQPWTVNGESCIYVHQFSSLKRGFGRRLFHEAEKRHAFIYLQSYSSFDQPRLDAYYTGLGMTRLVDGCATFFYKANRASAAEVEDYVKFFKDKY